MANSSLFLSHPLTQCNEYSAANLAPVVEPVSPCTAAITALPAEPYLGENNDSSVFIINSALPEYSRCK